MRDRVRIGSRESRLAVIQSEMVMDYIRQNHPGMTVELLTMKTTGDKILGPHPGSGRRKRTVCERTGQGAA